MDTEILWISKTCIVGLSALGIVGNRTILEKAAAIVTDLMPREI